MINWNILGQHVEMDKTTTSIAAMIMIVVLKTAALLVVLSMYTLNHIFVANVVIAAVGMIVLINLGRYRSHLWC